MVKNGVLVPGSTGRFSEAGINKIVTWCCNRGQMPYREVLLKQFGSVPLGMDDSQMLKAQVYFYNPDNLPGLHEIDRSAIEMTERGPVFPPCLAGVICLDIDNQRYVITMHGFEEFDFEEVSWSSPK